MSPDVAPSHKVHNLPQWPMGPRTAEPAPVRARIAREHRNAAPESCTRTALADDLRTWRFEGDGAATAHKLAIKIAAMMFATGLVRNLAAPDTQGLVAQCGVEVERKAACRGFKLLLAGPLAGWGRTAAPHAAAELRLADLLQHAVAVTPRQRVVLPLKPPADSITPYRSSPPRKTPLEGHFSGSSIERTRGVVNNTPPSPKNPDQARALLPAGPHIARTFDLALAAWRGDPAWGRGDIAEVARALAPDELWEGQRQVQRSLRSLLRLRVLVEVDGGLAFRWKHATSVVGSSAAALMAGKGAVPEVDNVAARSEAREEVRAARERMDLLKLIRKFIAPEPDLTDELDASVAILGRPRTPAERELDAQFKLSRRNLLAAKRAGPSDAMIALLERWRIDGRKLTRSDANKLWQRLYFNVVVRRQRGQDPLGPRERRQAMLKAGVPGERLDAWAVHGDPVVDRVARAIRRGVDPSDLLALFEPAATANEDTYEPSSEDLSEALRMDAANGLAPALPAAPFERVRARSTAVAGCA